MDFEQAFDLVYSHFLDNWNDFLNMNFDHKMTSYQWDIERQRRGHDGFIKYSLIHPQFEKIHSTFMGQIFYILDNKFFAKKLLHRIEHVFGIYFSVFWDYPWTKFDKRIAREYITKEEFRQVLNDFKEETKKTLDDIKLGVKDIKHFTIQEENKEPENEEYEKALNIIYEHFKSEMNEFLEIKEKEIENNNDPSSLILLMEFEHQHINKYVFKSYLRKMHNKMKALWDTRTELRVTMSDGYASEELIDEYNRNIKEIESGEVEMAYDVFITIDREKSDDLIDEMFPYKEKKENKEYEDLIMPVDENNIINLLTWEKIELDEYVKDKRSFNMSHDGFIGRFSWDNKTYILKEPVPYTITCDYGCWLIEIPRYHIEVASEFRKDTLEFMHAEFSYQCEEVQKYINNELDRDLYGSEVNIKDDLLEIREHTVKESFYIKSFTWKNITYTLKKETLCNIFNDEGLWTFHLPHYDIIGFDADKEEALQDLHETFYYIYEKSIRCEKHMTDESKQSFNILKNDMLEVKRINKTLTQDDLSKIGKGYIKEFTWKNKTCVLKKAVPYTVSYQYGDWWVEVSKYHIFGSGQEYCNALENLHKHFIDTYEDFFEPPNTKLHKMDSEEREAMKRNILEVRIKDEVINGLV